MTDPRIFPESVKVKLETEVGRFGLAVRFGGYEHPKPETGSDHQHRNAPHGGVLPFHPKSTCLPQSTVGPYVVQIWSRDSPESSPNETFVLHYVDIVGLSLERRQGYLAHKKPPTPPQDPTVGSCRGPYGSPREGGGLMSEVPLNGVHLARISGHNGTNF